MRIGTIVHIVLAILFLTMACPSCGKEGSSGFLPPSRNLTCPTELQDAFELFGQGKTPPLCPEVTGGGAFGSWIIDNYGLRAYLYTIDHDRDDRAFYYTSKGPSNDHWHQLGNDSITVTAHNKGYLQYWDWTRGGKCLNRYRPETHNFSGGFKFVKSNTTWWNTLYDASGFDTYRRIFGIGYVEKETLRQGISMRERLYVPYGKDPVIISETFLKNVTDRFQRISLYEYWDVHLYELLAAPIMTAPFGSLFEEARWWFSKTYFEATSAYDPHVHVLYVEPRCSRKAHVVPSDAISIADYYPKTIFLASLTGTPEGVFWNQDSFFGKGGIEEPDAVAHDLGSDPLEGSSPDLGTTCLIMKKTIGLMPGEEAFVSYAVGYAQRDSIPGLVEYYRKDPAMTFQDTLGKWSTTRMDFVTPQAQWLRKELLWHSYYLISGSFFEEYFDSHIINQGSAYAYIHGANGAHRDFALFCLPLVYLRPDLAKEVLRYMMRCQDAATGKLPYAQQGYGYTTGALVHEHSSDLDLFFLMAVMEYLGATRDLGFLDEVIPFYPRSSGINGPVRDHLVKALDHLEFMVGKGPHGLIRAGSGDWNDVLIAFSPCPLITMQYGESTLNTAMAAVILPRLGSVLKDVMPEFAQRLTKMGREFSSVLPAEWSGQWMRRGSLGNGVYLGEDRLFLDAQPWVLLAGVLTPDRTHTLLEKIKTMLVDPSPAGALSLEPPYGPPFVPGSDTNGGTWAAIDSWLVWVWAHTDPAAAWEFYLKTTLAWHAHAYPLVWYGIWSGPDSFNAFYAERPGETFNWSVTPMTDFPVMNMNRHSGPLLDAIRLAGIDPWGERITIAPLLPFSSFMLSMPLMGIAYDNNRARGYYIPHTAGLFPFSVKIPAVGQGDSIRFVCCGQPTEPKVEHGFVLFEVAAEKGQRITWEIERP